MAVILFPKQSHAEVWQQKYFSTYGTSTVRNVTVTYEPRGVTKSEARKLLHKAFFEEGVTYREDLPSCTQENQQSKVREIYRAVEKHKVPVKVKKITSICSKK